MMLSSSWRRLRLRSSKHRNTQHQDHDRDLSIKSISGLVEHTLTTPPHFRCPISLDLMNDPVTLSTGITYDRISIETWFENGNTTCPVTNQDLTTTASIPNHTIRKLIQDWCVQNRSFGIDRIPTPRIPVTSSEADEIVSKLILDYKRRDADECRDLVCRIRALSKESERNKRCFLSAQIRPVLAALFETFATEENGASLALLEDVLSVLTSVLPLAGAAPAIAYLSSQVSLRRIVRLLTSAHLSTRTNAVLVLKDVLSYDHQVKLESFMSIEGASEALCQLIKEPVCPAATKASLVIIFYMVSAGPSTSDKNKTILADMGLVSPIIEGLVECEKSTSEKALAVLDALCSTPKGKEDIRNHGLSIPVLVKKLFRVSDLATEFSVSIIWKLCKNDKGNVEEKVLFEAVQVGAFQKLLLLLQIGCDERTKEKATEVLKMLNIYRNKIRAC